MLWPNARRAEALGYTYEAPRSQRCNNPVIDTAYAVGVLLSAERSRIECDHRLRQRGTFLPTVVRFRAASAKTNNGKKGEVPCCRRQRAAWSGHRV